MKRCVNCVLPETHETITFDENGLCNICRNHALKKEKIEWKERKKQLDDLVMRYKGQGMYDCIVPFSGGKDSTWTLYYLIREYKLKPLVVRFDHGFLRAKVQRNTIRSLRNLGADFHHFTPNWHVVRKLMLQSFLDKGDFCWHCHTGIFAYPMWVAIRYNIPLIFWGEPSSEYSAYSNPLEIEKRDEQRFNRSINLGITAQDMSIRLGGTLSARDLWPFTYPPLAELRRIKYSSVCLGSFIPWDVKAQSEIIRRELGWEGDEVENVPPEYGYEKIECYLQGVRDYIKYIKRGYTRPSHLASIDIRNNRISHEDGMKLVKQYEGKRPPSLDLFLQFVGLTEAEFIEIAMSHAVSPHEHRPDCVMPGERTPDFDDWLRDGPMERMETDVILNRWRQRRGNPGDGSEI